MDLAYELHDLVRTLDKHADRLLRTEGLSYRRYLALVIVAEHPQITGSRLAGALGVSEAATSGLVRRLMADGLLANTATPGSGNVRRLVVTAAGERTRRSCSELLGDALDRNAHLIGIDPAQLAQSIRALHDEVRTSRSSTAPRSTPAISKEIS